MRHFALPPSDLALFQAAQKATDDTLGKGVYLEINGFDPSKGETRAPTRRKTTVTRPQKKQAVSKSPRKGKVSPQPPGLPRVDELTAFLKWAATRRDLVWFPIDTQGIQDLIDDYLRYVNRKDKPCPKKKRT